MCEDDEPVSELSEYEDEEDRSVGHIGIGVEDALPLKDPYGKPDKN